jgi:glyoxylase-like metal-dependent hydrolase (beta-lactamase superfamily II)
MLNSEVLTVGPFEANCYIVYGRDRKAVVIDPGADAAEIEEFLSKRRLAVCAYICTHGHFDHVSALATVHRSRPAPVAMHPDDARWAFSEANSFEPEYPAPGRPAGIERSIRDGDSFTDGEVAWKTIATPGHSPGGVCLYVESASMLFTGDTLFAGSVGRTDLPGGDSRVLGASLKRLAGLPDDTAVYPGHGPATSLLAEKRSNFFLSRGVSVWGNAP